MKRMRMGFGLACTVACTLSAAADSPQTYCNPLPLPDLPRSVYEMGRTPHRQVSDPMLYRENGRWYVYPSAGFMWSSADDEIAVTKATDEPQWLPKYGKGAAGWKRIPVTTASPAAADGLYQTHVWLAGLPATVEFTFAKPQTVRAFRVVWREGCYNPDKGIDAGPVRYRVSVRRPTGEWTVACDASANDRDLVTDYRETEPIEATAARLEVLEKPQNLELGLSEWTLFGSESPAEIL